MSRNKNYGGFIMFEKIRFERLEKIRNNSERIRGRKAEEYYIRLWDGENDYTRGGSHVIRPEYNELGVCDSYVYNYQKKDILRIYHNDIVQILNVDYGKPIMSEMHHSWDYRISHEQARGGYVLHQKRPDYQFKKDLITNPQIKYYIYPVVDGISFHIHTDEVVTKYDVHCRVVNRKKAEKSWTENESKWLAVQSMFNTLDGNTRQEMVRNVHKEYGFVFGKWDWIESRPYIPYTSKHVEAVKKASEVSAFDEVVIAMGMSGARRLDNMKQSYKHYLNEVNDNFKTKVHPCENKYFPTNKHIKIVMREVNDE
jgi:acylphosphatase